jgi:hypothetical protein
MEHETVRRREGNTVVERCSCGTAWRTSNLTPKGIGGVAETGRAHVAEMEALADPRPFCGLCDAPHFGACEGEADKARGGA